MDRQEKQSKKNIIGEFIDLANGRFKDEEVDTLYDIVKNRSEYDGMAKTYKDSYSSWCSDGKFTRDEETTYTFFSDDNGVRIEEQYMYHDDDGQSGSSKIFHCTARAILNVFRKIIEK